MGTGCLFQFTYCESGILEIKDLCLNITCAQKLVLTFFFKLLMSVWSDFLVTEAEM